jgi:uncharacterized membrane protein YdcZ (DUF606 family)
MDLMFLYPLIGGAAMFAAIKLLRSKMPVSRAGYNLYNSGIAALVSAAMLDGIMEIAGTGSKWISLIRITGIVFMGTGVFIQSVFLFKARKTVRTWPG